MYFAWLTDDIKGNFLKKSRENFEDASKFPFHISHLK